MLKNKAKLLTVALFFLTAAAALAQPSQITGTITRWQNDRLEIKTAQGKIQKVAVNSDTKREVALKEGTQVTVEYRRKVGEFIIALRVLAAGGAAEAKPAEASAAPASVTGTVVTWSSASLLLKAAEGEVTLFLSPATKYEVKSLDPGLLVTVEYKEGANGHKLATRVTAAEGKKP